MTAVEEEFDRLIDPNKRGGKRRQDMLRCISASSNPTPYKIAKALYSKVSGGYRAVNTALKKFEKIGIIEMRGEEGGPYRCSLTDFGKIMCQRKGVILPSRSIEKIIAGLGGLVEKPLENDDIIKLRRHLTDDIIDVMEEIAHDFRLAKPTDNYPPFEKIIPGVAEARKYWQKEFKKYGKPEKPEPTDAFIISLAVLRRESAFERELSNVLRSFKKAHRMGVKYRIMLGKSKEEAEREAKRTSLRVIFSNPIPFNSFVKRDFEKISYGYRLKQDEKLAKTFDELCKWFTSFLKKCSWLVVEFVRMAEKEYDRQMEQYGEMWAMYELRRLDKRVLRS
jgi:hypothetical protein